MPEPLLEGTTTGIVVVNKLVKPEGLVERWKLCPITTDDRANGFILIHERDTRETHRVAMKPSIGCDSPSKISDQQAGQ